MAALLLTLMTTIAPAAPPLLTVTTPPWRARYTVRNAPRK